MSADDGERAFPAMFGDSDMEEEDLASLSTSSSSTEESEVEQEVDPDWSETGELQSFPFTNIGMLNVGPAETTLDFFNLLFNTTFMTILVASINNHAVQVLLESDHAQSRISSWHDTNVEEMRIFLGLLFHMGTIQLNRINDYWRKDNLFNLMFSKFMSRDRFLLILRNLSFSDSNNYNNADRTQFVKPVINFFNNLMKTLVIPTKNLTIDESVVLWRGRLKIGQLIKGKRHKYGVKLYVLTDTNGITQKMHIYCGSKDADLSGKGHSDKVVMLLMEDYLNFGHSLYMDSFFNSVSLAEKLLDNKTYVTGTLRPNSSRNPHIVTKAKINKGSCISICNSRGVIVSNYKDKKNVYMISTEHTSEFIKQTDRHGQTHRKPKVILEYKNIMNGVDKKNQMLSFYPFYNKTTRWYKKFIVHVMQAMMLNAYKLFSEHTKLNRNASEPMSFYDFRLDVIKQLLRTDEQTDGQTSTDLIKTSSDDTIHLPEALPKNSNGKTKRKDCRHCLQTKKIRKPTLYYCPLCLKKPGLCMKCFREYHNY